MRNVQSYKNQIIMYTYERLFSLCVNLFSAKHHRRKHCIAKPFGDAGDAAFVHSSLLLNEKNENWKSSTPYQKKFLA